MIQEDNAPRNGNELDDLDLQNLLKEHTPSAMPEENPNTPRRTNPASSASLPNRRAQRRAAAAAAKRKAMLTRAVAGVCAIALIIALGALCVRAFNAGKYKKELKSLEAEFSSVSADNEKLKRENEELSLKARNLEHNLMEMAGANEYIEGEAAGSDAEAQVLAQKLEAYTLLVKAQDALIRADRNTLKAVMNELSDKASYLDENASQAYYNIMEQMEEPNLG